MTLVSSEPQTPGGKVPGRRGAECARARCSHIALLPLLREGDLTSQPKPRALWPSKTTGQAGWISMLGTRRECYRNSTPHRSPKSQGQFTYFHALIAPALQKYILKKLKQVTSLAQSTHRATQTLGQGSVCRRRALCGEQPRAHPCAHDSSSFLQSALSYGAVPCIYLCPLDQHRCFRMPHLAEHQRPGEARGLEYQRGHS